MLILKVTHAGYRKGSDWRDFSYDDSKALISSVDPDSDEIPVKETTPGNFEFTEDFSARIYYLFIVPGESSTQDHDDFLKKELLLSMRTQESDELRFWFKNLSLGNHILNIDLYHTRDSIELTSTEKLDIRLKASTELTSEEKMDIWNKVNIGYKSRKSDDG